MDEKITKIFMNTDDARLHVFKSSVPFKDRPAFYDEERGEKDLNTLVNRDLARRRYAAERVICEFTKDPGYLHQYYEMRESVFTSVWELKHFCGAEDEYDADSHILVARLGNLVIGGCRLSFTTPKTPRLLPMEGPDFMLRNVLPELELPTLSYGEFSRLAVLPEYRSTDLLGRMYRHINRISVDLGLKYVFAIAPAIQAINTRRLTRPFHLTYTIRKDIQVPEREEYEGIKMTFAMMSDITPLDNPMEVIPSTHVIQHNKHLEDALS